MVELPLFVKLIPKNLNKFKGEVEMETQIQPKRVARGGRGIAEAREVPTKKPTTTLPAKRPSGDLGGVAGATGIGALIGTEEAGNNAILGGLTKIVAPLMGLVGIKMVLDTINKGIEEMENQIKEINPALAQQQKITEKVMGLALLPMSRVMTTLMKPYLLLMMLRAKKGMAEAKPTIEALQKGIITPEEAMEGVTREGIEYKGLMGIFGETTRIMNRYQGMVQGQTRDIAGLMAGYQKGVQLLSKEWFSGYAAWVTGFITSLNDMDSKVNEDILAMQEDISTTFGNRVTEEKKLPEAIKGIAKVTQDELDKITFAKDIKDNLVFISTFPLSATLFPITLGNKLQEIIDGIYAPEIPEYKPEPVHWADPRRLLPQYAYYGDEEEKPPKTISGNDFVVTPSGIIKTNPADYIIGTKTPNLLGSGGKHITNNISINVTGFIDDSLISVLVNKMSDEIDRKTRW